MIFAYDWCGSLDSFPALRDHARRMFAAGHEVHVVSGTGDPDCQIEQLSGKTYVQVAHDFDVPVTRFHIIHDVGPTQTAERKVAILKEIRADMFYDDVPKNVVTAALAGIPSLLVSNVMGDL